MPIYRYTHWRVSALMAFALLSLEISGSAYAQQTIEESAKTVIAVQIRRQGYECEQPKTATRDTALSKPDGAVWILTCGDRRYRVRLVPDMAAQVELLD